jgi:hypothetical protein
VEDEVTRNGASSAALLVGKWASERLAREMPEDDALGVVGHVAAVLVTTGCTNQIARNVGAARH